MWSPPSVAPQSGQLYCDQAQLIAEFRQPDARGEVAIGDETMQVDRQAEVAA